MNRHAAADAKRAWRAATVAREKAEEAFARAEERAARACGDDQWETQCDVLTAHARLEEAKDKESTAESDCLRLLREAQALMARPGR